MATRTGLRSGAARWSVPVVVSLLVTVLSLARVLPGVAGASATVGPTAPAETLSSCLQSTPVQGSASAPGHDAAVEVQVRASVLGGELAHVTALYSCAEPGGSVPIVGLDVGATTVPAGILTLSTSSPVTNADGEVAYTGTAVASGRVTVEIHGRGLCRATAAARACRLRVALGTVRAAPATRVHRRRLGVVPPDNPAENAPALVAVPRSCDAPAPPAPARGEPAPAFGSAPACTAYYLHAIDVARAGEGVPPMVLPTDWARLTTAEQLFVVADLERVDRGLPPYVGLSVRLDAVAQQGADAGADPALDAVPADSAASTWAGGMAAVLAADYQWVYDDGYGSANASCTAPGAAGCWGHRDGILGADTGVGCVDCVMGAGAALGGTWHTSLTEIFVAPVRPGAIPTFFTWQHDVLPYLHAVPSG